MKNPISQRHIDMTTNTNTQSNQIHYFAFNFMGWCAKESLQDCIETQLAANGTPHAVMLVHAPIEAKYHISRYVPYKFFGNSKFKPGEDVYFTPRVAPSEEVSLEFQSGCADCTDWTVEDWRAFAYNMRDM